MGGWTAETVAGKRVDAYEPPRRPRFGVVFLHGVGLETLSGNAAWTAVLEELDLACLCPHGRESWWTDRIYPDFDPAVTAERFILDSVVPHFEQRWVIRPRALGITGISMGGQGALRIAFKHPEAFPAV